MSKLPAALYHIRSSIDDSNVLLTAPSRQDFRDKAHEQRITTSTPCTTHRRPNCTTLIVLMIRGRRASNRQVLFSQARTGERKGIVVHLLDGVLSRPCNPENGKNNRRNPSYYRVRPRSQPPSSNTSTFPVLTAAPRERRTLAQMLHQHTSHPGHAVSSLA